MKHIDLFSGIGGFALAARWNGIETIQFVEIDPFCQKVLQKNFPGVPIHDDIKTFHWTGASPFILTGGFPCQPFSCAGKRRGREDDRYLWPEMLRVISEAGADWVVAENVINIKNMELDSCCDDLENIGYEVSPPLDIPACACGLPTMERHIWIIAAANSIRREGCSEEQIQNVNNLPWKFSGSYQGEAGRWDLPEYRVCRKGERIPYRMDRLKSLGNAIVPQVAAEIMRAIVEASRAI